MLDIPEKCVWGWGRGAPAEELAPGRSATWSPCGQCSSKHRRPNICCASYAEGLVWFLKFSLVFIVALEFGRNFMLIEFEATYNLNQSLNVFIVFRLKHAQALLKCRKSLCCATKHGMNC